MDCISHLQFNMDVDLRHWKVYVRKDARRWKTYTRSENRMKRLWKCCKGILVSRLMERLKNTAGAFLALFQLHIEIEDKSVMIKKEEDLLPEKEYSLNAKPLEIDLLVIKKNPGIYIWGLIKMRVIGIGKQDSEKVRITNNFYMGMVGIR